MDKRYVLMVKSKSKYDDYIRINYKLFDNYYDLQKHLTNFWFVSKMNYVVFEETKIDRDYSLNDVKGKIRS